MRIVYYILAGFCLLTSLGSLSGSTGTAITLALLSGFFAFLGFGQKNGTRRTEAVTGGSYNQSIVDLSIRLAEIINESLDIANQSVNPDTKISRLDIAKDKLAELKKLEKSNSFIHIEKLQQVEASINQLESDFEVAGYRRIADGNAQGNLLEKDGKSDEAIEVYESLLAMGVDTPFTYRRLAILYKKKRQKEEELRVLKAALNSIPSSNNKHYQWFADRLAKMV